MIVSREYSIISTRRARVLMRLRLSRKTFWVFREVSVFTSRFLGNLPGGKNCNETKPQALLPHLPYMPPNADRKPWGADAYAAKCGSEAAGCGYTRRQMRIGSLWVQMRTPPNADRKPLGVDVSSPNADRKPRHVDAHAAGCGLKTSRCQ